MAKKTTELENQTASTVSVPNPEPTEVSDSSVSAATAVTNNTDTPSGSAGFYMYIGPTIHGVIRHGSIYRGDRAAALAAVKDAVEKHPLIKSLIVSGDDLPAARLKVKESGNALYANYHKLLEN